MPVARGKLISIVLLEVTNQGPPHCSHSSLGSLSQPESLLINTAQETRRWWCEVRFELNVRNIFVHKLVQFQTSPNKNTPISLLSFNIHRDYPSQAHAFQQRPLVCVSTVVLPWNKSNALFETRYGTRTHGPETISSSFSLSYSSKHVSKRNVVISLHKRYGKISSTETAAQRTSLITERWTFRKCNVMTTNVEIEISLFPVRTQGKKGKSGFVSSRLLSK
ncbi:hypothetical protein BJ165DRAFT_182322 [Panaeolus papilionaceus]|nr:hypothetical protein BJ165DRAFT_182322 [Panaeolus papilionaceus]